MQRHDLTCPECGAAMKLRYTTKGDLPGRERCFYGCSRFPSCTATHGAHPDGRPLGIPANAETKAARIAAHNALALVMDRFGLQRSTAYTIMAKLLGVSKKRAHIALLDKGQCDKLISLLAGLDAMRVQHLTSA